MIKEFTIGFSRTVNLGNYESMRVEAQVSWVIDQNIGLTENVNKAEEQLRVLLEATWKSQHEIIKKGNGR